MAAGHGPENRRDRRVRIRDLNEISYHYWVGGHCSTHTYLSPALVSDPLVQCTYLCPALIVRVVVDRLLLFGSFFCSPSPCFFFFGFFSSFFWRQTVWRVGVWASPYMYLIFYVPGVYISKCARTFLSFPFPDLTSFILWDYWFSFECSYRYPWELYFPNNSFDLNWAGFCLLCFDC